MSRDDSEDPLTQAALSDPAAHQPPPEDRPPSPHWRLVILLLVAIAALAIVFRR